MMNKEYQKAPFPFFVDISGWPVLVIGGGTIATRRVGVLKNFGVQITVIAGEPSEKIAEYAHQGEVCLIERDFDETDLCSDKWRFVLTATDNVEINSHIVQCCRQLNIPVNNSSDQSQCDFFFPAIIEGDGLVIGVSSDGSDHRKVRTAAAQIRSIYGDKHE